MKQIVMVETFNLLTAERGNFYDRRASYDDKKELLADALAELRVGRIVMIERELVPKAEWDAIPDGRGLWQSLYGPSINVPAGTPTGSEG